MEVPVENGMQSLPVFPLFPSHARVPRCPARRLVLDLTAALLMLNSSNERYPILTLKVGPALA